MLSSAKLVPCLGKKRPREAVPTPTPAGSLVVSVAETTLTWGIPIAATNWSAVAACTAACAATDASPTARVGSRGCIRDWPKAEPARALKTKTQDTQPRGARMTTALFAFGRIRSSFLVSRRFWSIGDVKAYRVSGRPYFLED